MESVYTIAFVPMNGTGHVMAMIALAQTMRDNGHKCVFVLREETKPFFADKGLDCVYYRVDEVKSAITHRVMDMDLYRSSPFEKIHTMYTMFAHYVMQNRKESYSEFKRLIHDIKPDAIVVDIFIYSPAVVCAGVPWVTITSTNPLTLFYDDNLPPEGSGYGMNSSKTLWDEFRRETKKVYEMVWNQSNPWLVSKGAPELNDYKLFNPSPYLNLYLYPEELDYKEITIKDKTLVSFDPMIGYNIDNESKVFGIPEKLSQRSGKLIYISMGSICSKEVNLMKRLVSLLSNSKHRFIVSKGELGQEYELPDNMWGQNWLPQLQVLPIVDLVLTHGGNNTVTESLYFGKPMIVFPVFGDGYDNAQRVADKELGVRLDPYVCTQTELFEAMDSLLNDSQLKAKYENISQRMKNSKSSQMCSKLIEELITKYKIF